MASVVFGVVVFPALHKRDFSPPKEHIANLEFEGFVSYSRQIEGTIVSELGLSSTRVGFTWTIEP